MEQRPAAVAIVASFLFAAAAIAAVVGCSLLFPGTLLDRLWNLNKPGAAAFRAMGRMAGVLLLGVGAAALASAFGLLRRLKWGWWLAVATNAAGEAASFVVTGDWARSALGILISCAFLYALARRPVRRYFTHERQ